MLTPNTLSRAEARVPRYTSYPTAPHFTTEVGAAEAESWLAATQAGRPVSLYVHVPFCARLCWYCGCNTTIASKYAPVAAYLKTLLAEIAHARTLAGKTLNVAQIHFGGGTPNALSPADFGLLTETLYKDFAIGAETRFDVELDPRTLGPEMARALVAAGVTRINLGIQDFDPAVQRAIDRVQPVELVEARLAELAAAGLPEFGVDLLYGLPHQTETTIARTVATVARLGASRVALFGYAHVPWMKPHQKLLEPEGLPDTAARLKLAAAAHACLKDAGYMRVGIDHFARPDDELAVAQREGRLARNFQGYTVDNSETLIGFGPSAISAHPEGYVQNRTRLDEWRAAVESGRRPVARGRALTADDRLRRNVIERLMCDLAVDLGALAAAHGFDASVFDAELGRIDRFAAEGLCARDGTRVTVPERARDYARIVASAFDAYLDGAETRHSVAV